MKNKCFEKFSFNVGTIVDEIEYKYLQLMTRYALRERDVVGLALGPQGYIQYMYYVKKYQRIRDERKDTDGRTTLLWRGKSVFCMESGGIEFLLDEKWSIFMANKQ